MIKLHVIQAQFGDCFLIEYGEPVKYLLIDGGPSGTYDESLLPELKRIVRSGILEAVIITHVDIDHIKGILDLLADLKRAADSGETPFLTIRGLWMNTFSDTIDVDGAITQGLHEIQVQTQANGVQMAETGIAFQGIREGDKITTLCNLLGIPMNAPVGGGIFTTGQPAAGIEMDNLRITVVGPSQENLDNLKAEWEEWIAARLEELASLDVLAMSDKSIPNLSSLMFYLEADGKTFLFTGDGRGDHLLSDLEACELLTAGQCHVHVFKVPHHASNRNTNRRFFSKVTADIYVISANGKHGNPDYDTLQWIVEEAEKQARKIKLVITNETDNTRKLEADYDGGTFGYKVTYIPGNRRSVWL